MLSTDKKPKTKYQISLYLDIDNYEKLQTIIKDEKIAGNRSYSATQFINDLLEKIKLKTY